MIAETLREPRTRRATPSPTQRSLTLLLGLALVASCSKPSSSARAASGGGAPSIDACALLRTTEIQRRSA